jgi:hypothetical protein
MHNISMHTTISDLAIENIHKNREWNQEHLKNTTVQERLEKNRRQAEHGMTVV